jgi:hypothetical protein
MMASETIYVEGVPVGRIVVENNTQEIAFLPAVSPSKLKEKDFESLEELRNAVFAAYQDKDQGVAP